MRQPCLDSVQYAGIVGKGEDMPCPVDGEGRFTPEVTDFSGRSVSPDPFEALLQCCCVLVHMGAGCSLTEH